MKERPLDSSPLFSGLRVKERLLLSKRMETQKFSKGEEIFAQGAPSEALYLVESGWVRLTREEEGERITIATLGPGDLLEEGFFLDRPYSVGAEAASEVTAWKLAKADLLAVVKEEPQIGVKLSIALGFPVAGVAEYLARQRLAKISLFSSLPTSLLLDIAERLRPKGYERGEKICQAGDPAEAIYIVESGRIEALPGVEGEEISSLGEGGLFGEIAVLTGGGYGATYRAATQVTLWALSKEEFGRLAQAHPLLRRAAGEHLRAKVFGRPVAAEPVKARAPRIRLPLRPISLGQGVRMLPAAFRDLMRWQAHQRSAIRIQLGVVVLLLIWLCGISAPTAVISSMTGGEGIVALLATPTPTFTPTPIPTDTPTPTPTFTPMPTDTPTPTPTFTPMPTDTPVPSPTATPVVAVAPTATPIPPTPTPTPSPVPVTVTVYDVNGNLRDMNWVTQTYGSWIEKATPGGDGSIFRVVELRETEGPTTIKVWVRDSGDTPLVGVTVRCSWDGEEEVKQTEEDGSASLCAMGIGSYIDPDNPGGGAYSVQIWGGIPSDIARGLGMLGRTNHRHLDVVFQLIK